MYNQQEAESLTIIDLLSAECSMRKPSKKTICYCFGRDLKLKGDILPPPKKKNYITRKKKETLPTTAQLFATYYSV